MSICTQMALYIWTLAEFLFGSRAATLRFASRPDTLLLGLVFVLSAGFAREYDRSDLFREPWQFLLPCVASLGASLGLFPLIEVVAWRRGVRAGQFWSRFRTFLGLFWMTAPLGWIYAIPVESFLPPDDAIGVNLWFLSIVTVWRILLVTRILTVLYVPQANEFVFTGIFFVVMLFADTMAIGLWGPFSFPMMGGAIGGDRHHTVEHIALGIKFGVTIFGMLSWPVWLIGTLTATFWVGPHWSWTVNLASSPHRDSRGN